MIGSAAMIVADRTGRWSQLETGAIHLYQWGVILGAVVVTLGLLNVAWIHLKRIIDGKKSWVHSAALLAAMIAVFIAGILSPAGIDSPLVEWVFSSIIAPGQATLFALLAFFMLSAAFLFLRADRPGGGWILFGALLMMTAQAPVAGVWMSPSVSNLASWALDVPGMATIRGALLGSSIAAIVVGARFLIRSK